jgi:hypothetical protein
MTLIVGLLAGFVPGVWADSAGANQLMKDYVPWYAQPAPTVGPAEIKGATGKLLDLRPGSSLYMEGDSTLHKYQMTAKVLEGSAALKGSASPDLVKAFQTGQVKAMVLVIPLQTLNSRDSGLDKNAYEALLAKDHPNIQFRLAGETLAPGPNPKTYVMTAWGTVTAAGQEAPVTLTADTTFLDGQVRLTGIQKLKMTDFKVKPPTMSILVLKVTCTDEIEIHYDVTFAAR